MDSLLITDDAVTDASVHDSQVLPELIDEENRGENLFRCVQNRMGGPELEYIGLAEMNTGIGLSYLAYNLLRPVRHIK